MANEALERTGVYFYSRGLIKDQYEVYEKKQCGVIRVNCVDCLDRTNYTMTFIGACALYHQIKEVALRQSHIDGYELTPGMDDYLVLNLDNINQCIKSQLLVSFSEMFNANGDELSSQYAGSQAMHSA